MPYLNKSLHVVRARELKERNRAAGYCVHCGKSAPARLSSFRLNEGQPQWACAKCSARHAADLRERYKTRLAAGICGSCGKNPLETQTLCHSCREDTKARAREVRLRLIEEGRCVKCRRINDTNLTRCSECNEKHNRTNHPR